MKNADYPRAFARGADKETIPELVKRTSNDVRELITTQIAVYRLEAMRRGKSGGIAVAMFLGALALLQAALVALLVGLTMWAAVALGTGWAILLVVGCTVLLALALVLMGLRQLKTAISPDTT